MIKWNLETLKLKLRYDWKISRASARDKTIWIVKAQMDSYKGLGEVSLITSNSHDPDLIPKAFAQFLLNTPNNLDELDKVTLPASLRAGIEMAWTDLLAQKANIPISEHIGTNTRARYPTSYSIPIMKPKDIPGFIDELGLKRFSSLKVKIESSSAAECCLALADSYDGKIRIDANESFDNADQVVHFLEKVKKTNIELLEQPLPTSAISEYKKLKPKVSVPLIADESIQDHSLPVDFPEMFHGVNIKLMKAGGYSRALSQIQQAKALNLKVMLGCMVETSLGIDSALNLAAEADYLDLDGFLFFAKEPFNRVFEKNGELFKAPLI